MGPRRKERRRWKHAFTDRAKRVLKGARIEAERLQTDYIGPEHLLLALVAEGGGIGVTALGTTGVSTAGLRAELETLERPRGRPVRPGEPLPYTSMAKKSLELALDEARQFRHDHVGTEHLLLGLVQSDRSTAGVAFRQAGGDVARLREAVTELSLTGGIPRPPEARSIPLGFQIDDESALSVFHQIIDGVKEAIATGQVGPGDRLPTVRALADRLDVAPGTVARAYRALEEEDVVDTHGSRGTRVADQRRSPAPPAHEDLVGLLRPSAVAAFHLGASARALRAALDAAMEGIFDAGGGESTDAVTR